MLTIFPNKNYPEWTVDAFNAVNINLLWKVVDVVYSKKKLKKKRSSHRSFYLKKVFLKISQNSQENICVGVTFLKNVQAWGLQLY